MQTWADSKRVQKIIVEHFYEQQEIWPPAFRNPKYANFSIQQFPNVRQLHTVRKGETKTTSTLPLIYISMA